MRFMPLLVLLAACGEPKQTEFESLGALVKAQEAKGFVRLGRFGESWPATIVDERTAEDEISFTRANGTPHKYPGYTGYTLKVVTLKAKDGEEVIVVFRSKEKR